MIGLRAKDQIHRRSAGHDLLALGLGDAAGDADQHLFGAGLTFVAEIANAAEFGIDLFGGLFANVAGVQ